MADQNDVNRINGNDLREFNQEQFAGVILTLLQHAYTNGLWYHSQPCQERNLINIFTNVWAGCDWQGNVIREGAVTVGSAERNDPTLYDCVRLVSAGLRFLSEKRLIEPDHHQGNGFYKLTEKGIVSRVDPRSFGLIDIERDCDELVEKYRCSINIVEVTKTGTGDKGLGTAFKINENTLLSCKHNFDMTNITDFSISESNGNKWEMDKLEVTYHPDPNIDLALVRFITPGLTFQGESILFGENPPTGRSLLLLGVNAGPIV